MLSDDQFGELRERLLAERARILNTSAQARSHSRDRDRRAHAGSDSIDESAEETLLGTALGLADRDQRQLQEIAAALDRLAKGCLDECEDCGDNIAFPRLRARPFTTLCVSCQEERETDSP